MNFRTRRARRRRRGVSIIGICVFACVALASGASDSFASESRATYELQIVGSSSAGEDFPHRWVAIYRERPQENSSDAMTPAVAASNGGSLPAVREVPVEFVWNFGDGTPAVSTGERPVVHHRYSTSGTYTMSLEMRTRDGRSVARTERQIEIKNRRPSVVYTSAVASDTADATIAFTAHASDAPGDTHTYYWDFGDGERLEGADLWEVEHRYPLAGTYPVTVRAVDEDGEERSKTFDVIVEAGSDEAGSGPRALDDAVEAEAVVSGFTARSGGAFAVDLDATIRSLGGMHLGPVSSGACRFVFFAWDPVNLAHVSVILDMDGLAPEGGRYTFNQPGVSVVFEADGESYDSARRTASGPGRGGLGALGGLASRLPDDSRREIGDRLGLNLDNGGEHPAEQRRSDRSPLGIEKRHAFRTVGGTLELIFLPRDRATASFNLTLENPSDEAGAGKQMLSLEGTFALDLLEAARDGMFLYDLCQEGGMKVTSIYPEEGQKHLRVRRPAVRVRFDQPYDPSTVTDGTFQLGYPARSSGEFVPVAGKLLRSERSARFVPAEPLMGGVRYEARVKTGPEGVLSRSGAELEDDGSGWFGWKFTTAVSFEADAGPGQSSQRPSLACHLFQTVRDAPLIAGKPVVARVYASWREHPEVHPDAQVRTIDGTVKLLDAKNQAVGSTRYRFFRPDQAEGLDTAAAEHTANVFGWTPESDYQGLVSVAIEVETTPGETDDLLYRTLCPLTIWSEAPVLTIDLHQVLVEEWEDQEAADAARPAIEEYRGLIEDLAWQLFPFADVRTRFAGVLKPASLPCDKACVQSLVLAKASVPSGAQMVVGLLPLSASASGGNDKRLHELGPGSPGVIRVPLALDSLGEWRTDGPYMKERTVSALVHEIGHALTLPHLPYIHNEAEQSAATELRNDAIESRGPGLMYSGIEGFRMARDGRSGHNKSSIEGNGEGSWLAALMYPATIPPDYLFIARHHYLQIQRLIEEQGGF